MEKLKKGSDGPVEVTHEDVRATADVVGSGPYGSEIRGLSVERERPRGEADPARGERTTRAVEKIASEVGYLSEPIAPFEVDAASGKGVLRTKRSAVKGREYVEIEVDGGDRVDVGRFRGKAEGGRERLGSNIGHGVLRRLVDDLEHVVGDRREKPRDPEEG